MMLLFGSDELLYDNSLRVTYIPAPAYMKDTDLSIHNHTQPIWVDIFVQIWHTK